MRIRIVSYDIMNGGVGRADPVAEVLLAQHAHIIAIHKSDDLSVLRRLSDRLSMDFALAASESGNVAILSKGTIIDTTDLGFTHPNFGGGINACIQIDSADGTKTSSVSVCVFNHITNQILSQFLGTSIVASTSAGNCDRQANTPILATRQFAEPARSVSRLWAADSQFIARAWVETDRLACFASDHLPVGIEVVI